MLFRLGILESRSEARYDDGLLLVVAVRVLAYNVLACVIYEIASLDDVDLLALEAGSVHHSQ